MKRILFASFCVVVLFGACAEQEQSPGKYTSQAIVTSQSKHCLQCHTKKQPAIVAQWQASSHAEAGIGCYECHQAKEGEADAFEHFDRTIAVIVSPKDCARCHEVETEQFLASHHAKGGEVLGSLDAQPIRRTTSAATEHVRKNRFMVCITSALSIIFYSPYGA